MRDAAHEALTFASGRSRADLDDDRMLVQALVRSLEVIGEAAAHVSPAERQRFPSIPWQRIVGMRNRLVHAYFEIDLDLVWGTVVRDVPQLVAALEADDHASHT